MGHWDTMLTSAPFSPRDAKIMREMLRLGSFTVSEIVALTGESEQFINIYLLLYGTEVEYRYLVPVSGSDAWAVAPDKQEEILKRLG